MKGGGDMAISVFHSKVTTLSQQSKGQEGSSSLISLINGERGLERLSSLSNYNSEVSSQHIPFLFIVLMTKPDSLTGYVIKDRVNNLR